MACPLYQRGLTPAGVARTYGHSALAAEVEEVGTPSLVLKTQGSSFILPGAVGTTDTVSI